MTARTGGEGADDEVLGRAWDRELVARLWPFVGPYRGSLSVVAGLLPVLAVVELVHPYLVKVAIDEHIAVGDWAGLSGVAAVLIATLLVQYALRFVTGYLTVRAGQCVVHDLRAALFARVQRLPARFFDRTPVGRLMTRVLGDVEAIGELFASGVVAILGDVLVLVGIVLAMLALDWRLALVSFAAVPILFALAAFTRARARAAYREVRTRIAQVNAYLQEHIVGMAIVQLFGQEGPHGREFQRLNEQHRAAVFRRMRYDALLYAGVETIGSTAVAGLIWWGGGQILAGALTFGTLVAFMEYTHRFFLPIRDLSAKYAVMQSAMVALERITALLDRPAEIESAPDGFRPGPESGGGRARPALEFRDVWFAYDRASAVTGAAEPGEAGSWVLRGLDLRVEPGERVAVVGVTGAGKTTVARLLNRSYDVGRGVVLVDGVDVRTWDLQALRRHVGLVPQDAFLFADSIEGNLRAVAEGAAPGAVQEALRAAHLEGLVRSLPQGVATPLGERGIRVSHGQRQLLAVARALIYNPPVLVLDEATSGVDPDTELLLQDAMDRLLSGRTSVIIAHRLSTVRRADRVIVLHHGRIQEEGSHERLAQAGGLYATLCELAFGRDATGDGQRMPA